MLLALMLVSVSLTLFQTNFIKESIDAVLVRDSNKLIKILLLFILLTVIRLAQIYLYDLNYAKVFAYIGKDLKNEYIGKILGAKLSSVTNRSSGELITKISSDIDTSMGFLRELTANFLFNPLMTAGGFIYLMCYNWKLSLVTFMFLPLLSYLLIKMSDRSSRIYRRIQDINSVYAQELYDVINGAQTIRAYNMQSYQLNKVRKVLLKLFNEEHNRQKNGFITLSLIMSVTYIPDLTALIYGAYLISQGEITVSLLFAYSTLISTICTPTIWLFSSLNRIKNSYQSMQRLSDIKNLPQEREDGQAFNLGSENAVVFEDVFFSYSVGKPILNNFTMTLKQGKCIGLCGSSGAGKTTITGLICGLYEADSGKVSIFGHDIKEWCLSDLRSHIVLISQETHIFPGTIYENIGYGNPNADKEQIKAAAELSGLGDFIRCLPDGYDTSLTEGGGNLSGGQRRRIAVARAFISNASLFIFDEPTASLDPETEALVVSNIKTLIDGKASAIVISHDSRILAICDDLAYVDGKGSEAANESVF